MHTITLEIPDDLVETARQHQAELPRIVEQGLKRLNGKKRKRATKPKTPHELALAERARILQILAADEYISIPTLDPEISKQHDHPPIAIGGKPLSEIIIADRGPL